jgi:tRNA-splicing ligase RtcB
MAYGQSGDVERIREDLIALGYGPTVTRQRQRISRITVDGSEREFTGSASHVGVNSTGLVALLAALGLPLGKKAEQDFDLPDWLRDAPRWQKRLFLAGLFGAELSKPALQTESKYKFRRPKLSMNKREPFLTSGYQFLARVADLAREFDVETQGISQERSGATNKDGSVSYTLRLAFSARPESLINLWSKIGFEYNNARRVLANAAVQYLKHKLTAVGERQIIRYQAAEMYASGVTPRQIVAELGTSQSGSGVINTRFLERSMYKEADQVYIGREFPGFEDYKVEVTSGLGESGMTWERVVSIEPVPNFTGDVYDFTVAHTDHNFVANGFVVSNCGVRALTTGLDAEEIRPYVNQLVDALYKQLPSGVGVKGHLHVNRAELEQILTDGSKWALREGYATRADVAHTEDEGRIAGATPAVVSNEAKKRGLEQVGTLGSGNHFAEIDVVREIYDPKVAEVFGLRRGQAVLQIHCGSRGLGHQVATDYIQEFQRASKRFGFELPDRQLVCAPLDSPEGQNYLAAMNCAANYAWANRQVLTHWARAAFEEVLAGKVRGWDLVLLYDVAHNIAKLETHEVEGKPTRVCVHRKGATRAFGPGHPDVPADYRSVGQPVLVPGSMGTASYILVGTTENMQRTFGSCCHGAGRMMSRTEAKHEVRGAQLREELAQRGIVVRAGSLKGLAEEAPDAYKDVDRVVKIVAAAGLARLVARLEPLAVIKG